MNRLRWLTEDERDEKAKALAAEIETHRLWNANPWRGGNVVRVYMTRDGLAMGYLTIFEDGQVRKSLSGDDYYHRELDSFFLAKSVRLGQRR